MNLSGTPYDPDACAEYDDTPEAGARHKLAPEAVPDALLAGHAIVTFVNTATGGRFTYQLVRGKDTTRGVVYFVKVLTGPDNTSQYTMFGVIRDGQYRLWSRSTLGEDAPSVRTFVWLWARRSRLADFPQIEAWHEGRCLRCGRRLTVPESIAGGIGPECARKMAA